MSDDAFKPLLMGYLDSELTEIEVQRMQQHLNLCADCSAELEEFRKLKEVTKHMKVLLPYEQCWEDYWSHVYNRIERRLGWILISVGAILLTSFGLYKLVSQFLFYQGVPLLFRIAVLVLVAGFCTLLISVLRERIFLSKSDKYERIKR